MSRGLVVRGQAAGPRGASGNLLAGLGLLTLAVVAGCQGSAGGSGPPADVGGSDRSSRAGAAPTATGAPTAAPVADEIQRILDAARPTEEELGLAVDMSYGRESGLAASTLAYCGGGQPDPADQLRTARSQRWWISDAWPDSARGAYTVGVEVVHYEPGGADATMAAFQAVPEQCPTAQYASGTRATFVAADPPAGLSVEAMALADQWTYPNGIVAHGFIIAIPSGDVVGFLYIRGDETAVHERVGELASTLAADVSAADAQIKALDL